MIILLEKVIACHSLTLPQQLVAMSETVGPMALCLAESRSALRHTDEMMAAARRAENFQALIAVALAQQSQQIAGLAQFQAASMRSSIANKAPSTFQDRQARQTVTSPVRRQFQRERKALKVANAQSDHGAQQPVTEPTGPHQQQSAAGATGNPPRSAQPMQINDGIVTVYPGQTGVLQWTVWAGRSVLLAFAAYLVGVLHCCHECL